MLTTRAVATTINVPTDYSTLQGAINAAVSDPAIDRIQISFDVAEHDMTIDGVTQNLTFEGLQSGQNILFDAGQLGRHFVVGGQLVNTGTITFQHIDFRGGQMDSGLGGCIQATSADLAFESCGLYENSAVAGGCISISGQGSSL